MYLSLVRSALLTICCLVLSPSVQAADYPTKPVTLIVPFAPGSSSDTSARLIAQSLSKSFGQPVVIENKVGAGGTIAATHVSRSKPDGYTLFWTSSSVQVIAPFVMPDLSWDPVKSFIPIGLSSRLPQVIAVNSESPIKSFRELIDRAKARPGDLNYATLGPNTTQNLIFTIIMNRTGFSMTQVPYTSAAQIYPDLLSGRIDVMLDNLPNILPFAQQGKLRPLAVTTRERVSVLPDTPTIAELALPDFEMVAWGGMVVPAGTPTPIVATISDALSEALKSKEYTEYLKATGSLPANEVGSEAFGAFLRQQLELWKSAVQQTGVAVNK